MALDKVSFRRRFEWLGFRLGSVAVGGRGLALRCSSALAML